MNVKDPYSAASVYDIVWKYGGSVRTRILFVPRAWHRLTLSPHGCPPVGVQLAGVVAVEITGGPTIDFVPGRKVFRCPWVTLWIVRTNGVSCDGGSLSWIDFWR